MNINITRRSTIITDKAIYTHPKNFSVFKGLSGNVCCDDKFIGYPLDGIPVYIDDALPSTRPTGKVKFPNWKFCEFEEKDEQWALALGFATREEEPVYYMVDTSKFREFKVPMMEIDFKIENEQLEEIQKKLRESLDDILLREMAAFYKPINNLFIGNIF